MKARERREIRRARVHEERRTEGEQRRNSRTGSYLMLLRRLCQRYYTADSQGSEGATRQRGAEEGRA